MDKTPSKDFTTKVNSLKDWRGPMLARLHAIICKADPGIVEEVKWKKPSNPTGTALFSHNGMVCTAESYKDYLKMTFAYGASVPDPAGLFNAPFTGATRRAINIREGDKINEKALITLIRDAVALNQSKAARRKEIRERKSQVVRSRVRSRPCSSAISASKSTRTPRARW